MHGNGQLYMRDVLVVVEAVVRTKTAESTVDRRIPPCRRVNCAEVKPWP